MGLRQDGPSEDVGGEDGNTTPLLGSGQMLPRLSTSSSSAEQETFSNAPEPPMNINTVVVNPSDGNVVVHIGEDKKVNMNHIFYCSNGHSECSTFSGELQSDIERTVAGLISKTCASTASPLDWTVSNKGTTPTDSQPEGKAGLQSKWFYWVIILVALSALVSVLLAVVAAVKTRVEGLLNESSSWWILMLGGVVVALSCINLVTNMAFSLQRLISIYSRPSDKHGTLPENIPDGPRMMVRWRWGAQPPSGPMDDNPLPIRRVVIIHTASEELRTTPMCIDYVRQVQSVHIEARGWSDIAYNFLVGGDGIVFVGRDWDTAGAHTKSNNKGTLGVAFIGTFTDKMPSDDQINALHKLLELGLKLKKLSEDYKIVAHCQLQVTASPGKRFVEALRSWPRFDSSLPLNFGSSQ